jgi:type III secretion system chaperone SycN
MTAPGWLNAAIGEFGRAAGAPSLALNERGAAALAFENGAQLRFEYTGEELAIAVTLPGAGGVEARIAAAKRLFAVSHPKARYGQFRVRTGILARSGRYVLAVRLPERDATLPHINTAFALLWRLAEEIGGSR